MAAVSDIESKILAILKLSSNPVKTLEVAKALIGPKGTTKEVNPHLYALQTKGLIRKIANPNGSDPRWIIVTSVPTPVYYPPIQPPPF